MSGTVILGTEICAIAETGRQYFALTTRWIDRLRRGADPGPEIAVQYLRPRPTSGGVAPLLSS